MLQSVKALLLKPSTLLVFYIAAAIFVSLQLISLGTHPFSWPFGYPADIMNQPKYMSQFPGLQLTEYNNYLIFKNSFFHLNDTVNSNHYTQTGLYGLYGIHPHEHWDLFKYSPTFAFFMGALAYIPNVVGLPIWNLLNTVTLFLAIRMLPFNAKTQCLLLWFIANELFTCLSNTQSNSLMCGLMIAAYSCMQHGKLRWATLWLVVATFIKVYGAVGFCLFLFYPGKIKFMLYALMWSVILFALPLIITPLHTLLWQYQNWAFLLKADASEATGMSVTGWLHSWFGVSNSKTYVTAVGVILFLIPLFRYRLYRNDVYRLLIVAFIMIWVVIFNHKAESATYIIAVTGVGIWYFLTPKAAWRTALLLFVLLCTSLTTTDFFPLFVREHYFKPYAVKTVPCIVVWCVVFCELMMLKPGTSFAGRTDENLLLKTTEN